MHTQTHHSAVNMLDKLRMEEFSTGFRTRVNEIRHKLQRNCGSLSTHVAGDSGHSAQTSQPPKSHYSLRKKLLWRQFCEDVKKEDDYDWRRRVPVMRSSPDHYALMDFSSSAKKKGMTL